MKPAMMMFALICSAVASAAPGEVPGRLRGSPSPTNVAVAGEMGDELAKKLSAALPPTMTLVDTRSVLDQHKTPRWIAGLRFSQPGLYTIKHSCTLTPPREGVKPQTMHFTYPLWIVPRGTPRVHLRSRYLDNVSPTACVGDIVELSVGVYPTATADAFTCDRQPLNGPPPTAYAELGDVEYLKRHLGTPVTPEGRLVHLDLVAAGASGASSRLMGPRGFTRYSLSGLFKCKRDGRFTLHATATVDGKPQTRSVPVVIVPAGQSIRVLASRIEQVRQSARFRSISTQRLGLASVVARVGDYLSVDLCEHKVTGDRPGNVRHPTVSLREGEFGNDAWPLRGGLDDPSRATAATRELTARLAAADLQNERLTSHLAAMHSQISALERTYAEQAKMMALLTEQMAARDKGKMGQTEQLLLQQRTLLERERELERSMQQLVSVAEQLAKARIAIEKLTKENAALRAGGARAGSPAEPKPPKVIEGRVTAVSLEHNVAQLNVGSAAGVTKNMQFILYRGASFVGYFVVSDMDKAACAGVLKDLQMPPRAGDRATTRLALE